MKKIIVSLIYLTLLCSTTSFAGNVIEVEVIYPPDEHDGSHNQSVHHHAPASDLLAMTAEQSGTQAHSAEAGGKEQEGQIIVDQLIDKDTLDPAQMFRFSPSYVELAKGDSIRFLNSLGKHTVVSVNSMLPKGAKPFSISHKKTAEVTFNVEGIYGIRCKVHTRYGMVMLVKVGDDLSNLEQARKIKISKRAKQKFDELFQQLDKAVAKTGA